MPIGCRVRGVAAGALDLVIESGLKPHDYNALIPVVRGAGGVIGNWRGADDFTEGILAAAATPELFEEAVRLLNTLSDPPSTPAGPGIYRCRSSSTFTTSSSDRPRAWRRTMRW